jgi:hypothetical protein
VIAIAAAVLLVAIALGIAIVGIVALRLVYLRRNGEL